MGSPPEGWPPFIIVSKRGLSHEGIMIDVMREITNKMGYKVDIDFYPEKRSMLLLEEGRIHAYAKAKEWTENPSAYLWSAPVMVSEDILVSNTQNPVQFQTVHELSRHSIGSVYGFSYPALDAAFASDAIHHHTAKDTESILRMVQRGHIDAAATNRNVAEWIIRNQGDMAQRDFTYSSTIIGSAPYRFAFCNDPKWEQFLICFNRELASMKSDGRLQAIFNRYR